MHRAASCTNPRKAGANLSSDQQALWRQSANVGRLISMSRGVSPSVKPSAVEAYPWATDSITVARLTYRHFRYEIHRSHRLKRVEIEPVYLGTIKPPVEAGIEAHAFLHIVQTISSVEG